MKNGWKTEEDKLLENMRIPAEEKLRRIKRVMEFTEHFSTRRAKKIRKVLLSEQ